MSQKLGLIKNVYIWKEKSKMFSYLAASVSTAKMTEIDWIFFVLKWGRQWNFKGSLLVYSWLMSHGPLVGK